jgi:hypothetical protein
MRWAAGLGRTATVALVGLALACGSATAFAQMTPPQRPEQRPPHHGPRPPDTLPPPPGANICTTQWGWCQLPTITAPFGVGCTCLTADNQEIAGTTRYFPYYGPASPYLQPHTTVPETVR